MSCAHPLNITTVSQSINIKTNHNIPTYKTETIPDHPNNSPSDDVWKIKLNTRIYNYCSSRDNNFKIM